MLLDTERQCWGFCALNNIHLSVQKYLYIYVYQHISLYNQQLCPSQLENTRLHDSNTSVSEGRRQEVRITVRTMKVMINSNNKSLHINISNPFPILKFKNRKKNHSIKTWYKHFSPIPSGTGGCLFPRGFCSERVKVGRGVGGARKWQFFFFPSPVLSGLPRTEGLCGLVLTWGSLSPPGGGRVPLHMVTWAVSQAKAQYVTFCISVF